MYLNKAMIIGNLTRDPEMRALPSGNKVCSFSLATNRVWKDKNGAKQESVDYHNIVVFGRQAEIVAQYLRKGASALIEGRIQTRSWDDKDGSKKYRTEIVADTIQFGPRMGGPGGQAGGQSSGGSSAGAGSSANNAAASAASAPAPMDTIEYPEEEINPDDIPF
ncbi:single-stranded DNA-binding protein [bacterium]|nr:single-stranded DNA-binding protein [bacterium]